MFTFNKSKINSAYLTDEVRDDKAGGFVSFEGWVRNHNEGQDVSKLEYEAYEALGLKEGQKILQEAMDKFDVISVRCEHRTGLLGIGEMAVWVGVAAVHRGEAFAACEYVIDNVKVRVPIWKKEYYTSGDSGWVKCDYCAVHEHHKHHS